MPSTIITEEDLQQFKSELLEELESMFQKYHGRRPKRWLKSHEVMELLQISPGTLIQFRNNGLLTFSKVGRLLYYDAEQIDGLLVKNQIQHPK